MTEEKRQYPDWFIPPYEDWKGIVPPCCPKVGDKVELAMVMGRWITDATIYRVDLKTQWFWARRESGEECGNMPFGWYRDKECGWMFA